MKRGFRGAPRPLLPSMLLVATNPNAGQEHAVVAQSQPSSSTPQHIYKEPSPVHQHFSPPQEQAPSQMSMDDLLQAVPELISRIDSLETDLKQTKLTMGNAIVKLVKKVKEVGRFEKEKIDWDLIRAKIEANAKLSKSMLGSEYDEMILQRKLVDLVNKKNILQKKELGAKRYKPMTYTAKELSFEEVKKEFKQCCEQKGGGVGGGGRRSGWRDENHRRGQATGEARFCDVSGGVGAGPPAGCEKSRRIRLQWGCVQQNRKDKQCLQLGTVGDRCYARTGRVERREKTAGTVEESRRWEKVAKFPPLRVSRPFPGRVRLVETRIESQRIKGGNGLAEEEEKAVDKVGARNRLEQLVVSVVGGDAARWNSGVISRDDLTELYRIVMNRYGMDGPEDDIEKSVLDKKLQGGKPDENCYKMLKMMEKQAGIRK
ncbi:hypothetical protein Tco_0291808 [Tanacetum coccineum]